MPATSSHISSGSGDRAATAPAITAMTSQPVTWARATTILQARQRTAALAVVADGEPMPLRAAQLLEPALELVAPLLHVLEPTPRITEVPVGDVGDRPMVLERAPHFTHLLVEESHRTHPGQARVDGRARSRDHARDVFARVGLAHRRGAGDHEHDEPTADPDARGDHAR